MKPTLGKITQSTTFDAAGRLQRSYIVSFMVGDHGPFSVTVPQASFTAEGVRKAMQEVADTIDQIAAPAA